MCIFTLPFLFLCSSYFINSSSFPTSSSSCLAVIFLLLLLYYFIFYNCISVFLLFVCNYHKLFPTFYFGRISYLSFLMFHLSLSPLLFRFPLPLLLLLYPHFLSSSYSLPLWLSVYISLCNCLYHIIFLFPFPFAHFPVGVLVSPRPSSSPSCIYPHLLSCCRALTCSYLNVALSPSQLPVFWCPPPSDLRLPVPATHYTANGTAYFKKFRLIGWLVDWVCGCVGG